MIQVEEILRQSLHGAARDRNLSRDQLCDQCVELEPRATINPGTLAHWVGDQRYTIINLHALVVTLARAGQPALLESMARQAGCFLARVPEAPPSSSDDSRAGAQVLSATSLLLQRFLDHVADGVITEVEREELADLLSRAHSRLEGLAAIEDAIAEGGGR